MVNVCCTVCGTEIKRRRVSDTYFCDPACRSVFLKGRHISEATQFKAGFKQGTNNRNPNWKGEEAGKQAIHGWLNRHFGKPQECEKCLSTSAKRYDWANVSGDYRRDRTDFLRLCRSCHMKMDKNWIKKSETIYKNTHRNKKPNNTCHNCGDSFWAKSTNRQYCTKNCWYARNKK